MEEYRVPIRMTDEVIAALVAERKRIPADFRQKMRVKPKSQEHIVERELLVLGEAQHTFIITATLNTIKHNGFAVQLMYASGRSGESPFILRRYDGAHAEHYNPLDSGTSQAVIPRGQFHIHLATARYQAAGLREETYAEPMERYANLDEALACLIDDCGFELTQSEPSEQEM